MEKQIKKTNKSLLKDTRGLSTVEYVIILALIAVAGITLWDQFGTVLGTKITGSKEQMDTLKVGGSGTSGGSGGGAPSE